MSGTYKALGGETFNQVARIATGDDTNAAVIKRANPGVPEPIPEGVILQVPVSRSESTTSSGDELEIKVDNIRIGTFDNFALSMAMDAIWKCGFTVPNEPETRDIFRPLKGSVITVDSNGERLFTGRAEPPRPDNQTSKKTLEIECYATPGILGKVSPPASAFPLEWTNANLPAIAGELCGHHGVEVDFRADPGPVFERVDIGPTEMVLDFLAGLADEHGPFISNSETGELVFWTGAPSGAPVSNLEKGLHPCENFDMIVSDDHFYSSVTGDTTIKVGQQEIPASKTVRNPFSYDLVRPYNFTAPHISPNELETIVNSMAGRMFGALVTGIVDMSSWISDSGKIYRPNQTVILKSPDDFVEEPFEFFISEVSLFKSSDSTTAILSLSLPGAYNGEIPERMPFK